MNHNRILYEDNDILVCHKPAGIATQTARVGQADMVSEITNYLVQGRKAEKTPDGHRQKKIAEGRMEGNAGIPYVGVVHRLDQPVEGILVFAKHKHAAADLSRQAAGDKMKKEYLTLVCGEEIQRAGELTDYLLKDGRTNLSRVVPPEVKGAKLARLSYEVLSEVTAEKMPGRSGASETNVVWAREVPRIMLVRICLYTGRHHQIRVQMANAGMSILGDRKYAGKAAAALSEELGVREIALCAYRLSFVHPKTGERMQFEIEPEGAAFLKNFGK